MYGWLWLTYGLPWFIGGLVIFLGTLLWMAENDKDEYGRGYSHTWDFRKLFMINCIVILAIMLLIFGAAMIGKPFHAGR